MISTNRWQINNALSWWTTSITSNFPCKEKHLPGTNNHGTSVYTYGWSVWTLSGLLKFDRNEIIIQYPFNKIFKHQNDWELRFEMQQILNTQPNGAANSWFYWFNEYYSLNNNNTIIIITYELKELLID